ncbi:exosortase system-associated protein, TIGR04073 family [Candidatus Sumerlaeota bacterium]|nr:exosortase system-associated protein, TIGR04073 family [Candidatus Sumerlaeota bacterium]
MISHARCKIFVTAALMAALLSVASQSYAASSVAYDDVTRESSALGQMAHKFGRGVVNVFTGWVEVPKAIAEDWREKDPFTGFITGFVRGAVWGAARTATGIYEVVTFPVPIPSGYGPLIEPEYVLPTIWGDDLPSLDTTDWEN